MKYNININQLAGQKHFKQLDILDLAILDYFKDFAHNALKITDKSGTWFWISNQKVIDDMPVLGIKSKRGIQIRIKKLIDAGIIKRHEQSMTLGRSYYQFTPRFDNYLYINANESVDLPKDTPTKNDAHPYAEKDTPMQNDAHPLRKSVRGTTQNDAGDYSIKDSSIIDSSIIEKKEINKKGLLFFKSCFKEKFNAEYIAPKNKNETYQLNAIEKLIELRPKDTKRFIEDCFSLENEFYLNKISPAHILANYSEYCAAIINEKKPKTSSGELTYDQVVAKITANVGMTFDNFVRVGEGKPSKWIPKSLHRINAEQTMQNLQKMEKEFIDKQNGIEVKNEEPLF